MPQQSVQNSLVLRHGNKIQDNTAISLHQSFSEDWQINLTSRLSRITKVLLVRVYLEGNYVLQGISQLYAIIS